MLRSGKPLVLLALAGVMACRGQDAPAGDEPLEEMIVEAYASDTLGAIQVTSASTPPRDWFEVLQNGRPAYSAAPPMLGATLELLPGTYVVDVNRTQRTVTVEAGRKLILRTGDILVEGEPEGAYWYPMQGGERRLTSNPSTLNAFRAFFPGDFEVYVHESVAAPDDTLGVVTVLPGRVTTVHR